MKPGELDSHFGILPRFQKLADYYKVMIERVIPLLLENQKNSSLLGKRPRED
jgi:hypothetical protein